MKERLKIVDTNVILRFLLFDDEDKAEKAKRFLREIELGNDECLLTDLVFAEVIWVLQKVYKIPRAEIAGMFGRVVVYKGMKTVTAKAMLIDCLDRFAKTTIDIQDIFLATFAERHDGVLVSFDRNDLRKLRATFIEP